MADSRARIREGAERRCQQHEGFVMRGDMHMPYECSEGYWTVGYGHRCKPGEYNNGITELEAIKLFNEDWEKASRGAEDLEFLHCLHDFAEKDAVRHFVLVEMVFQLGKAGVSKFQRMWDALEHGDYPKAADEMTDSRWHEQTPTRCNRLANMMRLGF